MRRVVTEKVLLRDNPPRLKAFADQIRNTKATTLTHTPTHCGFNTLIISLKYNSKQLLLLNMFLTFRQRKSLV